MIQINDVYKRYRTEHGPGRWVLNGISLTIPPKVNVGLIGANGAGKSTLLRLIGGIDHPTKGSIKRETRVSWPMGLGSGLQPSLTGRQNAKFICRIYGQEFNIHDRIAEIQDFAEIGAAFDEPIKTYSTGMKSRLQFAISLAVDFDVYISDEVTAAGDAAFRKKAETAFENLIGRSSLIIAAHSESTLKQFCKSGILLNEGAAHWFEDINEAIREYKKTQLINQIELTRTEQTKIAKKIEPQKEKDESLAIALSILNKGLAGEPIKVDHDQGVIILAVAKELGMHLLGPGMIKNQGYQLKSEAMPLVIKYNQKMNKYINPYDANTQCIKIAEEVN